MRLIIAAKLDPHDKGYFDKRIKPRLSYKKVSFAGEIGESERNKLMSNALAFLHPVTWDEPFGLTLIEAMATGCPIVAFNKGSIPEIVVDGVTGYIVNTSQEMVDAIKNIHKIDRNACRSHAMTNFSASTMVKQYESLYFRILKKEGRVVYP